MKEGHAIWESQKEAVRAILKPDQQPLYEQFQKEQDEQRKRRQQMRRQEVALSQRQKKGLMLRSSIRPFLFELIS